MGIGALLVLWLGSREVVAGRMTIGELVAFNTYLMMLAWPMIAFGWVTNLLQRGMASWKRMLEVLDAQPAIYGRCRESRRRSQSTRGEQVEFRNLTFAFGEAIVLRDISFDDPAGTTTAIVGATGSGKSTLLNLLPRLHEPPPGTVFIDGVDVRHIPLRCCAARSGSCRRSRSCSAPTLAENIAFGAARRSARAAERMAAAAASRGSTRTSPQFPKGYDTMVGERGITLSGGQKQRDGDRPRAWSSIRGSSSSTTRCRRWTPTRRRRFCERLRE